MKIINAPDRIYLQIDDESYEDEYAVYDDVDWNTLSMQGITWAEDKAVQTTIEYVHIDVYNELLKKYREVIKNGK